MAFDGNGNWIPEFSAKEDRDAGVKILASRFDDVFQQDLKESFEKCLTNDGQSRPLKDFNFNNNKGINVADPETDSDVVNVRILNKTVGEKTTELKDMLEEKKANVDGSNFTEETSKAVLEKLDKETKSGFVALGMPDSSGVISLGGAGTYTAPGNGWISAYSGSTYKCAVKNNTSRLYNGGTHNTPNEEMASVPCRKGDSVSIDTSGAGVNVYFVPCIGG